MFKYCSVLSLALLLHITTTGQQKFTSYGSLGFVASQVEGDNLSGFNKAGIAAGLGLELSLDRKWAAGFELMYVQKGSLKLEDPDRNDYRYYRLNVNYIEVPVLLQYKISKVGLFAGGSLGILVSSREETEAGPPTAAYPFERSDVSICAGASYRFAKKWSLRARFSESLLPIRRTAAGQRGIFGRFSGQYNTAIILTINFHL
jgi:hypothetical protein